MSARPLFSDQFERVHGRPMEFFLSGGQKHVFGNEQHYTNNMEEDDEFIRASYPERMVPKLIENRNKYWEEVTSRPADLSVPLRAYREDPVHTASGDYLGVARNLMALDDAIRNGRTNNVPLYRGALNAPHVDALQNKPISFSENRHVAGHFARFNRNGGRGQIFKVGQNEVRGIRLQDFGIEPKTIGPSSLSEAEWLIDPRSISG